MNNRCWFIFLIMLSTGIVDAQVLSQHLEYIEQYKQLALREMQRARVPASIKLAQAILESGAGTTELAQRAKNHFGVKCGSSWRGASYYKMDDEPQESCFRSYDRVEDSYIDHSDNFWAKKHIYGALFDLDITDYRAWAHGLKRAGYATAPDYAQKLINIVERYELWKYDTPDAALAAGQASSAPMTPQAHGSIPIPGKGKVGEPEEVVFYVNDTRATRTVAGETPKAVARRTFVSTGALIRYNDAQWREQQALSEGTLVYIQSKRNSWRGKEDWHTVKPGETVFSIAQSYGIRLKAMYKRNRLVEGKEPAQLARLKIKGGKVPPGIDLTTMPGRPASGKPGQAGEYIDFPDITPPAPKPTAPQAGEDLPPREIRETREPAPTTEPGATAVFHTVVAGDTLFSLARRYGTTVSAIKSMNNLSSDTISTGSRLRVQ
jgi:LysM repeat protein